MKPKVNLTGTLLMAAYAAIIWLICIAMFSCSDPKQEGITRSTCLRKELRTDIYKAGSLVDSFIVLPVWNNTCLEPVPSWYFGHDTDTLDYWMNGNADTTYHHYCKIDTL